MVDKAAKISLFFVQLKQIVLIASLLVVFANFTISFQYINFSELGISITMAPEEEEEQHHIISFTTYKTSKVEIKDYNPIVIDYKSSLLEHYSEVFTPPPEFS